MKKVFTILLAIALLGVLCACQEQCRHEYKSTASIQNCSDGGVKTMTCTKCGHSYTEALPPMEHSMDGWLHFDEATDFTPGVEKNICGNCGYTETRLDFYRMFHHYAEILLWLPAFEDPAQLQNFDVTGLNVISAAYFGGVVCEQVSKEGEYPYVFRIHGVDMDAFTQKCFGRTYDYTGVENLNVAFASKCSYDAENNSLYITAQGAGDELDRVDSVEYTSQDDVHYTVTVHMLTPEDESYSITYTVKKIGENYIIASK